MINITRIKIANFRSITSLDIKIKNEKGLFTFCGENNVGKTNILKALSLFFDKKEFISNNDCPYYKYYGTRGGNYRPKIEITFNGGKDSYHIIKDWNLKQGETYQ
ncbi:AAA family ATPase [Francisella philomiragia]|uniref:AAA family ATPase n=1 Tax=Francisella philomiragia TaxID=28110 RepID=UPI001C9DA807|nr:AAA family ATPase [Francisella philomiragia]MBY7734922.1 AAA family ATPase [Francisella philomiragia]